MYGTWETGIRETGRTARKVGLESCSRLWKTSTTRDSLKTIGNMAKVASSQLMVS